MWPERTAVHPSAASFRSMLRNRGWSGLVAADNSVADGIRNVSSHLVALWLLFAHDEQGKPAASGLERELLGYVCKRGEDEPLMADDHMAERAPLWGAGHPSSVARSWLAGPVQPAA
ncbi:hypothetical protein [Geodermatophilus sp. DSM 45219]|uniref:hypothetical protein n=1 Tax=Geodermatophilus sp. DSM 45219 TaxID=1881103 RepID=UPI000B88571C|nr:hypothetical protein [Geodermatophilus sp. DSM 45219]